MAEAARRFQPTGSPDVVRRLMARPVRLAYQARTRLPSDHETAPAPCRAEAVAAKLEVELSVMKAVVRVQRREIEALRAQRQLLIECAPDEEVRATRERWAALVDGLIAYGH
jgi:hypothetical protein